LKLVKALLIYKQIQRNNTMNRLTSTLLAIAMAASAGWAADPPGAEPKPKTPAEVLYEKLLVENTKPVDAAYVAYLKALDVANQAILKKLEAAKKEYNDMKKFPGMDVAARAAALAEIDKKIEEVKKGAVADVVVAARGGDLLGGDRVDLDKAIVGKWKCNGGWIGDITFNKGIATASSGNTGKFIVNGNTITINWVTGNPWVFTMDAPCEVGNEPNFNIKITKSK
jgi:hypothetical protein